MDMSNYCSVVQMTHDEKVKMYEKLKKKELIEMLIEANNVIDMLSKKPTVVPEPYVLPKNNIGCRTWSDCSNPFKDCVNCPLRYATDNDRFNTYSSADGKFYFKNNIK